MRELVLRQTGDAFHDGVIGAVVEATRGHGLRQEDLAQQVLGVSDVYWLMVRKGQVTIKPDSAIFVNALRNLPAARDELLALLDRSKQRVGRPMRPMGPVRRSA